MADQPVLMLNPDGDVIPMPAHLVQDAISQRHKVASPEQVKDYLLQQKYGTAGQQFKTAVEATLRGGTFGGSDQVLTKTGLVAPEDMKGRQEANPLESTGFELGGALLPMAIPGVGEAEGAARLGAEGVRAAEEASTLAKAARFAPSNLISRAGKAAEGVAAKALATDGPATLAQTIARNAASKAIGSAVEGAAYTAGHEVSEQALDPQWTAQAALAHIGLGTFLGGALGGGLGAAEAAIPTAVTKAKDALANIYGAGKEQLGKLYGSGVGQAITGTSADTAGVLMANKENVADLLKKFPDMETPLAHASPESAEYVLNNFQKALTNDTRQKTATETREQLQNLLDATTKAHKQVYTDLAPKEVESLLQHADPRAADEQVGKLMDRLAAVKDQMRAEPELYNQSQARALEQMHEGLTRDAVAGLTPAESFQRLNTLRQQIDEITTFDTKLSGITDRNTNKALRGLRSSVRDVLHDEDVWGQQAARKAALDDATADWLKLTGKKSNFKKIFLDSDGKIATTKVDVWLNAMGKDKGKVGAEALADFLDSARNVIDQAGESARVAPVGDFDHKALTDLVNRTADQTQAAREAGKVTATMKYMQSGGMGIPNSGGLGAAATHAGHAINGAVGFGLAALHPVAGAAMVAGKALEGIGSVPKTVATLAALERMAQKVDRAIDSGVAALVKGTRAGSVLRGEAAAGLSSHAGKDHDEQEKSFEKHAAQMDRLAADPQALQAAIQPTIDALHPHAPDNAVALAQQIATGVGFLASKRPHHPKAGILSSPYKMTPMELGKQHRYKEAVHDPLSILRKAAAGNLASEHMEAVRAVHPQALAKMQTALIASMPKDPTKIPYKSRRGIGMILGMPADGSFTPAAIRANQAAYAPSQAQGGGKPTQAGLAKLTVSNRLLTPQQSTTQR